MPTYFQMDFSCSMSLQNTWTTLQRESRLSALLGTQSACIFPIHKSKQWASFCYIPRKKHFWKLKSHFKENHEYAHNTTLIYPILLCIFNLSCALHFLAYQLYAYYKVFGGGFFAIAVISIPQIQNYLHGKWEDMVRWLQAAAKGWSEEQLFVDWTNLYYQYSTHLRGYSVTTKSRTGWRMLRLLATHEQQPAMFPHSHSQCWRKLWHFDVTLSEDDTLCRLFLCRPLVMPLTYHGR